MENLDKLFEHFGTLTKYFQKDPEGTLRKIALLVTSMEDAGLAEVSANKSFKVIASGACDEASVGATIVVSNGDPSEAESSIPGDDLPTQESFQEPSEELISKSYKTVLRDLVIQPGGKGKTLCEAEVSLTGSISVHCRSNELDIVREATKINGAIFEVDQGTKTISFEETFEEIAATGDPVTLIHTQEEIMELCGFCTRFRTFLERQEGATYMFFQEFGNTIVADIRSAGGKIEINYFKPDMKQVRSINNQFCIVRKKAQW